MDSLDAGAFCLVDKAIEADQHAYQELVDQLQAVEESKSHLESEFQEERRSLQAEIERINSQLQEVDFTAAEQQKCSAQLKSTRAGTRGCNRTVEGGGAELAQVKTEFEDLKALESRHAEKVTNLLEEQAINLCKIEESRAPGEDLEAQI
ncbi:hypothetical protein L208DRAFT_1462267 [Tricholoma matsutake]|nr:hypothetical protein L208DRAFT_1462267 [Tricholoma matsutake 945]